MSLVGVEYEELWEPWKIGEDVDPSYLGHQVEIPQDIIDRFEKAKAEMESVWEALSEYVRFD